MARKIASPAQAGKYVAYYRVSTKKQGESGLGLEAQQEAVRCFVNGAIIAEFTEVESGKNDQRLQLAAAIDRANKERATLVIAKLDRLSRNAGFIFSLKDSGVNFECVDMPQANTLTIGIFATLAQHERELISSRTKAALQAKKERGEKLGKPENLTHAAQLAGGAARRRSALENIDNRRAASFAQTLRAQKLTLWQVAHKLNADGFRTSTGCEFRAGSVLRLLNRVNAFNKNGLVCSLHE